MDLKENRKKEKELLNTELKDALNKLFSKKWYTQIPNLLTLSRGISPLVIAPLVLTGNISAAVIAQCIFASTDFFDGKIARKFNFYSDFGKKLDTVCDKIFAISLLLPMISILPITIATIGLEGIISIINAHSMVKGNNPKSSYIGKSKTFFLSTAIILTYLSVFVKISPTILNSLLLLTGSIQSIAAIDYYKTDKAKDKKKAQAKYLENNDDTEIIEINEQEKEKAKDKKIEYKEENNIIYSNVFPLENEQEKAKVKTLHQ